MSAKDGGADRKMAVADRIMTVKSLAIYLQLHPATIYRLARHGILPGFRIGTEWRFKQQDIDEWTEAQVQAVQAVKALKDGQG